MSVNHQAISFQNSYINSRLVESMKSHESDQTNYEYNIQPIQEIRKMRFDSNKAIPCGYREAKPNELEVSLEKLLPEVACPIAPVLPVKQMQRKFFTLPTKFTKRFTKKTSSPVSTLNPNMSQSHDTTSDYCTAESLYEKGKTREVPIFTSTFEPIKLFDAESEPDSFCFDKFDFDFNLQPYAIQANSEFTKKITPLKISEEINSIGILKLGDSPKKIKLSDDIRKSNASHPIIKKPLPKFDTKDIKDKTTWKTKMAGTLRKMKSVRDILGKNNSIDRVNISPLIPSRNASVINILPLNDAALSKHYPSSFATDDSKSMSLRSSPKMKSRSIRSKKDYSFDYEKSMNQNGDGQSSDDQNETSLQIDNSEMIDDYEHDSTPTYHDIEAHNEIQHFSADDEDDQINSTRNMHIIKIEDIKENNPPHSFVSTRINSSSDTITKSANKEYNAPKQIKDSDIGPASFEKLHLIGKGDVGRVYLVVIKLLL